MDRFRHVHFFDEALAAIVPSCPTRHGLERPRGSVPVSREWLDPETSQFVASVLQRNGLSLEAYRPATFSKRLRACLRQLGVRSLPEAQRRLNQAPRYLAVALSALMLGVTQFFRNPAVFQYLEKQVFPGWIAQRRLRRIWSAGCANGAELYSIAMLLDRHHLLGESWLLGSDCRQDALQAARRGWYDSAWELAGLPDELRASYLRRIGQGWYVCETLRQATHWTQENLLARVSEEPTWDVIFCRNVAIYLEPPMAARLWHRLVAGLCPEGILITGKAERPLEQLPLQRLAPCVFQKVSGGPP